VIEYWLNAGMFYRHAKEEGSVPMPHQGVNEITFSSATGTEFSDRVDVSVIRLGEHKTKTDELGILEAESKGSENALRNFSRLRRRMRTCCFRRDLPS